jgi:Flp pilus assembly CpaF family ATPase
MQVEEEARLRAREAFASNFGKIAHLLTDDTIMDVSLNEPERAGESGPVFVDVVGKGYQRAAGCELTAAEAELVVRTFSGHAKVLWNPDSPCLSCQAVSGEFRMEAELPFATRRAPVFTIRKYLRQSVRLQQYVESGELSTGQAIALRKAVQDGLTILMAGETGSGKTTLLNALLHSAASNNRRVLTIEDTPELERPDALAVQLVVKPGSVFDYPDAVRSALRHKPDVIALGEIRTGEAAYEALDAWQTGHAGMGTLHAGSADRLLWKYLSLLRKSEAGRLVTAEELTHTINVAIHVTRKSGRRVFDLRRVVGWDGKAFVLEPLAE